jgi:multiple sugar transport system substrate-binding protein
MCKLFQFIKTPVVAFVAILLLIMPNRMVEAAEQVTITWMNWYTTDIHYAPVQKQIIAEFEKLHPNIKVEMIEGPWSDPSKLLVLIGTNNSPDVIWVVDFELGWYIDSGLLLDLSPYQEKDPVLMNEWVPLVKQTATAFSGLWGVPFDMINIYGLTYNRNMFDAAGVQPPTDNWTWDDYLTGAKKLTKFNEDGRIIELGGNTPYFTNWPGLGLIKSFGGAFVTADGQGIAIDQQGSISAHNFIREYVRSVMSSVNTAMNFSDGKVGMAWTGTWDLGRLKNACKFDWDVAYTPQGPNGRYVSTSYTFWGIPKASKHPDEAWKFIKFVNEDWAMKLYAEAGRIPPRIPLLSYMSEAQLGIETAKFRKVFIEQIIEYGYAEPPVSWYNEARTYVNSTLGGTIVAFNRSVEELVKQAADYVRTNIIPKYMNK